MCNRCASIAVHDDVANARFRLSSLTENHRDAVTAEGISEGGTLLSYCPIILGLSLDFAKGSLAVGVKHDDVDKQFVSAHLCKIPRTNNLPSQIAAVAAFTSHVGLCLLRSGFGGNGYGTIGNGDNELCGVRLHLTLLAPLACIPVPETIPCVGHR